MKTQKNLETERKIFEAKQLLRVSGLRSIENAELRAMSEKLQKKLPENETGAVWFEDTIAPIKRNEFTVKSSVSNSNSRGNTFNTAPYSEIYNMAVMRDTY